MLVASCTDMDDNERFTYVKPAPVARCVLLEDYTGQFCPNCPKAVGVIDQLHEAYGDNVIAVGIHCGRLSLSSEFTPLGLATAEGEEYYNNVGTPSQPAGRVNRLGTPSTIDSWTKIVKEEIKKTAPLGLAVAASYNEDTHSVDVTVDANGVDGTVNGKLQLWIVEDNIVAPQDQLGGSTMLDYVHNHVFRGSINGTWGEDFTIAEGETKTVSHTATLKDYWKAEDIFIVAFVYNAAGVLQAAKVSLIGNDEGNGGTDDSASDNENK